jgi:hypothetical protein
MHMKWVTPRFQPGSGLPKIYIFQGIDNHLSDIHLIYRVRMTGLWSTVCFKFAIPFER